MTRRQVPQPGDLPENSWYSVKRRLLGPPLVNEQLKSELLSKPPALGVLSCDGISSANYGSELILHELLPFFGLAAFTILLPMTAVILLGVALVVPSYREVVTVYTRALDGRLRHGQVPQTAQGTRVEVLNERKVMPTAQAKTGAANAAGREPHQPLGPAAGSSSTARSGSPRPARS